MKPSKSCPSWGQFPLLWGRAEPGGNMWALWLGQVKAESWGPREQPRQVPLHPVGSRGCLPSPSSSHSAPSVGAWGATSCPVLQAEARRFTGGL